VDGGLKLQPKRSVSNFKFGKKKRGTVMYKYECTVCGYIYDPAKGDPDGKIPPGTTFDKLPDNWVCPVCGVAKSEFKKI